MRHKIGKFVGKRKWSFRGPTARKTFKILLYLIFGVALLAGSSTQPKPVKPEAGERAAGEQRPVDEMTVEPERAATHGGMIQSSGILERTVELARRAVSGLLD